MWKDYVSLKELKKDLIFKKIVEWSESELILEDGTKLEVVCASMIVAHRLGVNSKM